jgi:hypothetical protein
MGVLRNPDPVGTYCLIRDTSLSVVRGSSCTQIFHISLNDRWSKNYDPSTYLKTTSASNPFKAETAKNIVKKLNIKEA